MARPELGTKRLCPNCGTKYYDLARSPILCPKCGAVFVATAVVARARAAPVVKEEEVEAPDETAQVELVSLEQVDAEEKAEEVPGLDDEEIEDAAEPLPDETFLEEDEADDEIDIDIEVGGDEEER